MRCVTAQLAARCAIALHSNVVLRTLPQHRYLPGDPGVGLPHIQVHVAVARYVDEVNDQLS